MIYLYLKTHNVTGLKYLGYTRGSDPYKYRGSGVLWIKHLETYGKNISTEILYQTEDIKELKRMCSYYSDLWNVAESKEFANKQKEGGSLPRFTNPSVGADYKSYRDYFLSH